MLRKIHRWIGLALILPFALQGLTGLLLVVLPLVLGGRPAVPPTGPATGPAMGAEAMVAAARAVAPAGTLPLRFDPARWPGDSAVVAFGPAGERHPEFEVMVDPTHATVLHTHVVPHLLRVLHNLHADLLLLPYGQNATGVMGVLLSVMAVTGLILWWPHPALWASGKWRRTIMVSPRARGYRLWRETHISLGFWTLGILLFLALSGTVLAFPFARPLFGVQGGDRPAHGRAHHADHAPAIPGEQGLDTALAALHTQMPDAVLTSARLGTRPAEQSFTVILPAYGPNRPATVRYDTDAETVSLTRDPAKQRTGELTFMWLHTLHEAKLAGPSVIAGLWRTAVGIAGAALFFFSISGGIMWLLRRRGAATRKARVAAVPEPSRTV
ncbi:PepSY domain-containing protein [Gluconacetobacter takamatsuzukensis]|uniref:PepSY domain-containing protein n=1 Tax=Gluconacetobacter takamatsuzukensis TaxID=1286190 RepID=A0A7W4PRG0_9PROT|nr:PepSY domain-containing protein [Gluconacetobacter takamatsuzukensis]